MVTSSIARSDLSASLLAWGTARADLSAIAQMRKKLPAWAPSDTPGHFLKHADEQTVLAVAAVDQAIQAAKIDPQELQNWLIMAAPRFIGRTAGVATLDRFERGGGPAISPHVIPQHSLHSTSGALSILLASRQPNFGVGGTTNSLAEGFFAALTFPSKGQTGTWLIATAWEPEPQLDQQGNCTNSPVCHAVALGLSAVAPAICRGHLRLNQAGERDDSVRAVRWSDNAAGLATALTALVPGGSEEIFGWRLPWGGIITLEAREVVPGLAAAA